MNFLSKPGQKKSPSLPLPPYGKRLYTYRVTIQSTDQHMGKAADKVID